MVSEATVLPLRRFDNGGRTGVRSWFGGRVDVHLHEGSAAEPEVIYWTVESPLGQCLVAAAGERLCYFAFVDGVRRVAIGELHRKWPTAEAGRAPAGLKGDFGMSSGVADLPFAKLLVRGTVFQVLVWRAVSNIGPAEVVSYAGLARAVGRPTAVRAVGGAVGANSLAWIIPCHRVVRGDGSLGGYRWGVSRKRLLLCRG